MLEMHAVLLFISTHTFTQINRLTAYCFNQVKMNLTIICIQSLYNQFHTHKDHRFHLIVLIKSFSCIDLQKQTQ